MKFRAGYYHVNISDNLDKILKKNLQIWAQKMSLATTWIPRVPSPPMWFKSRSAGPTVPGVIKAVEGKHIMGQVRPQTHTVPEFVAVN